MKFGIWDSLVSPVATYASPFWLPLVMPEKGLEDKNKLLGFWETFKCEILQQKCASIVHSVNKKT